MTIFAKHIDLQSALSVDVLSTRATARSLESEINSFFNFSRSVTLDFEGIEFASRSFMDELNIIIRENDQADVTKVNMNEQVRKMDELVKRSSKKRSWETMRSEPGQSEMMTI